jgi:hypothetical protein
LRRRPSPSWRILACLRSQKDGTDTAGNAGTNFARYNFLDPGARDSYADWDAAADTTVALLRAEAGRSRTTRACVISSASCPRSTLRSARDGARHNVRLHHGGVKRFHQSEVGPLELTYQSLPLTTSLQAVHTLTAYTAEPGSTPKTASSSSPAGRRPTQPRGRPPNPRPDRS